MIINNKIHVAASTTRSNILMHIK